MTSSGLSAGNAGETQAQILGLGKRLRTGKPAIHFKETINAYAPPVDYRRAQDERRRAFIQFEGVGGSPWASMVETPVSNSAENTSDHARHSSLCAFRCKACRLLKRFVQMQGRVVDDSEAQEIYPDVVEWRTFDDLACDACSCSFCAFLADVYYRTWTAGFQNGGWGLEKGMLEVLTVGRNALQEHPERSREYYDFLFSYSSIGADPAIVPRIHHSLVGLSRLNGVEIPHGSKLMQPLLNLGIAKQWLQCCTREHEHCSDHIQQTQSETTITFRLIDLEAMRLVEWPLRAPAIASHIFAALSYVWGFKPQALLNTANRQALLQSKGLLDLSADLPLTMTDFIVVCSELNYRYVWIDALCIVQDDSTDMASQMQCMGTVFSSAHLVVVSTAGSVQAGIPGVTSARTRHQEVFTTHNFGLVERPLAYNDAVIWTTWWSRGWCLQEYLLAKRLLIFTRYSAFFKCNDGVVCYEEDAMKHGELACIVGTGKHRDELSTKFKTDVTGNYLTSENIASDQGLRNKTRRNQYRSLMEAYNGRQLSYEEDRVNAILGALEVIGSSLWGIPLSCFSEALMWDGGRWNSRRLQKCFPSWSWAAWCDSSWIGPGNDRPLGSSVITPPLDIFVLSAVHTSPVYKLVQGKEACTGPCGTRPCEQHRGIFTALTEDLDSNPLLLEHARLLPEASVLRFWTWSNNLYVENVASYRKRHGFEPEGDRFRINVKPDKNGRLKLEKQTEDPILRYEDFIISASPDLSDSIGTLPINAHSYDTHACQEEFIAVNFDDEHVDLLLIRWRGPIAERVQTSTKVDIAKWKAAKPIWKLITLA